MNAELTVLDAANSEQRDYWITTWSSWPDREVQAHPGYLELFAAAGERVRAAIMRRGDVTVLYPFIQRPLPAGLAGDGAMADLTSPYGYSAPYAWGGDRSETGEHFWSRFDAWARSNGVLSEFVRLAVGTTDTLIYPGVRTERLQNVLVPTCVDPETLWKQYAHKVRKNVNKARTGGVRITTDPTGARLADFLRIYLATMTRREAQAAYYFTEQFFETLDRSLPGQYMYFHAMLDDRVVSTELALVSAKRMYSFLGGTDEEFFDLRPNDMLKHEMIQWAHEHGKEQFVLGGGFKPDDGIYRYKLSFAPHSSVPFYTGERVFDALAYQRAVEAQEAAAAAGGSRLLTGYFPAYRAPLEPIA